MIKGNMAGMIVGNFVHSDLDLSGAIPFLNLRTQSGKIYALKRLGRPVDSENGIKLIQEPIIKIRKRFRQEKKFGKNINDLMTQISVSEPSVSEIVALEQADPRILETTEQVFWKSGTYGSFINKNSLIIEFIIFYKTLFLPAFSILTPLLVIILPFILLKRFFNLNLPINDYLEIIKNMILSKAPNMPFGHDTSVTALASKYIYIFMSAGVFISNIWTQIQSAIHLRSVANDIRERGNHIIEYVNTAKRLAILLDDKEGIASCEAVGFDKETMAFGAFGMIYNENRSLDRLRDWISDIDLQLSIAQLKGICFPTALAKDGNKANMTITDLYHPGVPSGKRVLNSVKMSHDNLHMILTGPNRGGKSTLCKSIGFAIMTAQSWGFCWAKKMRFIPFVRIETALAPADTLGRLSLFEAEIEFAKHLLVCSTKAVRSEEGPLIIIMDEIFHSTNAHDGEEASLIFLKQLYEKGDKSVISFISTHYRELPEQLKSNAKSYCMEAYDKGLDGLVYTYRCIPGISNISSVKEILKERGLMPSINSVQESNEYP